MTRIFRFGRLSPYCVVLSCLLLGLMFACKEDKQDISGRYVGTQVLEGNSSPITVILRYNGDQLMGSVTPPSSEEAIPFSNGSYDGSRISFQCSKGANVYNYMGAYHSGDLVAASISGTFTQDGSGTGTFTARAAGSE